MLIGVHDRLVVFFLHMFHSNDSSVSCIEMNSNTINILNVKSRLLIKRFGFQFSFFFIEAMATFWVGFFFALGCQKQWKSSFCKGI